MLVQKGEDLAGIAQPFLLDRLVQSIVTEDADQSSRDPMARAIQDGHEEKSGFLLHPVQIP